MRGRKLATGVAVAALAAGAYTAGASRQPERATARANGKVDLWKTYTSVFKRARYVDLTHAITPNMPVWKGFGPAKFEPTINPDTGRPYTFANDGF